MARTTKYEQAISHAADSYAAFRIALKRFKDYKGYEADAEPGCEVVMHTEVGAYTKELLERDVERTAAYSEAQADLIADMFGKGVEQVHEDVKRHAEANRLMYF